MKTILLIIIVVLIYIIYKFYKENEELRSENTELGLEFENTKKLLKHIQYRCDEYAGRQWYGNANCGFRKIKELAKNKTLDPNSKSEI